jgi:signal transduction histidine kinase/CheY-like chemotaxis protein
MPRTPLRVPPPPPDFRALFESAPGLYLVLDPDLTIVAVSNAYLAATMTQREVILGRGIFDVFPDNPDDPAVTGERNLRSSLNRVRYELVPDTMAVQKYDIRRPESEGGGFEERHWSPINSPVLGADGELTYIIHQVEDVTEYVRMRQQGRDQAELTRTLRDRSDQMEAEIVLRAQQIQEANEKLRDANIELEWRVEERTAELAQANEALREEIALSRRLEEQFRQAQKMEAIGTLAGGVAHDFNNLLTVITGYSSMLMESPHVSDDSRPFLDQISIAADRATMLTRQLLAFSRQQVLEPRVLDLNEVVSETGRMLSRMIGEDIELHTQFEPVLGRVKVDPGQVSQVIMNLAINARDAMPQGGKLTIETANVELDASHAQGYMDLTPGHYVMLAVSDTGCGMSQEVRARIFEPFFTTKERGKGAGLGLATVFGIIKQSNGHVHVYSEPGVGTVFKVYLPLIEEDIPAMRPNLGQAAPGGNETILLVEDEEAVRDLTVLALQMFGYSVLSASLGREAIQVCERHAGPIHLLISDVIMPEMGGRRVADAILELRPTIKVLFLSGYTDDAVVRHGILYDEVAFLQKPFTPHALARKVCEVLDR